MKQLLSFALICGSAFSQAPPQAKIVVKIDPVKPVTVKPGQTVNVAISAHIDPGFHVNADKQSDRYLIPVRLTWAPGVLESAAVTYPKFETTKLAFSEKPVNIYSGDFVIETRFKVSSKTASETTAVAGKLRFQACNERECLIPRTLDVSVPVEVVK